ncbi:MAG: alternate F1F0 ATPase, F1 subunit alpha [Caldilineaceae bacterium]|nr:alternate F1F0 ATPase, F1 subunit alpha [Caldilineaceae bacterium]
MPTVDQELRTFLDTTFAGFARRLETFAPDLARQEFGVVTRVGHGVAQARGLPGAQNEEIVLVGEDAPGGALPGIVFNLDEDGLGVILLGESERAYAGARMVRTGRVADIAVGESLLGRVINAVGAPLDELGPVRTQRRRAVEQPAPPIMHRAPVTVPLQTGWTVVDALLPIGRGQRELILGDRQTGKTALAVDAMINQRDKDVLCVYCAIGRRSASVARVIADLRLHDALRHTVVMVASGDDAPGLQFIAPYAATAIAEHFMQQGRDVLIVYDDLTSHARAYRELSLLLRRPPGREAFPGDIFYIHSRLLERATHLRPEHGGGSITALPIVETHGQDMSAYIPTNLISITDGQIYLSPTLFQKNILPAVEVGRSVSRVGGKAQLPAYRAVAGALRLAYAQFEELEIFSRFSTRLDEQTRQTLARGRRVRAVLKQPQFAPISAPEQIAILHAVTAGALDAVPLAQLPDAQAAVRRAVVAQLPDLCARILAGELLDAPAQERLERVIHAAVAGYAGPAADDGAPVTEG